MLTDVLVLPLQLRGSGQADRLRVDLVAAYERGLDPGSRAPHIQAGGERLLELTRAFEDVIDDWPISACGTEPQVRP